MSNWTENHIQIDQKYINYYRTGKGDKPALILVHGFTDNGLCWTPVARALEDSFDVIMPDMVGHGLSSRVGENEDVDMVLDLVHLIDELKLDKPIIGGHSMGSMVTYELAIRFPEIPRAMFFEDPLWLIDSANPPFISPEGENPIVNWAKTLPGIPIEDMIEGYTKDNPTWPKDLIQIMCESKKQLDMGVVDKISNNMLNQKWDWQVEIKNFPQPFMLFSGEPEKGGFVTPEVSNRVKELRPDAITIQVPGVGHLIRFDGFPLFIEGLKGFLKLI